MLVSIVDLYKHYRNLGLSHVEACRKIQADSRQFELAKTLHKQGVR